MDHLQTKDRPGLALDLLCAGLCDPVMQSQQIFRQVLTALAEPGTRLTLPPQAAPQYIHSAAYQVCLALLDADTPLWVSDTLASDGLVSSLRFHCGCPFTPSQNEAAFALATPQAINSLRDFRQGTHEYPDRSTTLIVQVEKLHNHGPWHLSGPGIDGSRQVGIEGLTGDWPAWLQANRATFPLGIDLLLTDGNSLMGLPRTTNVEMEPCM